MEVHIGGPTGSSTSADARLSTGGGRGSCKNVSEGKERGLARLVIVLPINKPGQKHTPRIKKEGDDFDQEKKEARGTGWETARAHDTSQTYLQKWGG